MTDPRNLHAYVSAYQPTREHVVRLTRGDSVTLTADLSGAVSPSLAIESATWRCLNPMAVRMTDPQIDGLRTTVRIDASWGCGARMKCEVALDDGSQLAQLFRVYVRGAPWFPGESAPVAGPFAVTATAEVE